MTRILIFTGKGGVGKSTQACAHARKSALEGKKTLLVSTDMAHNLGDIFSVQLGKEPKEVAQNLDVLEIDPAYVMEHDFRDMMRAIVKLMSSERLAGEEVDAVTMFPGMEELFSLLKILDLYESDVYEEKLKRLPNVGAIVKTEDGEGEVDNIETLKEVVRVKIKDGDGYFYKKYNAKDVKIIKNNSLSKIDEEELKNKKELEELEKLEVEDEKERK